jgi:2-polyprenyl-3-methyl-5-hydroxy-6-metoxy-1,4-benzoquinol methylase
MKRSSASVPTSTSTGTAPAVADVRRFWESHPLATAGIAYEPGTREFYEQFRVLREQVEPPAFQAAFYQYGAYAGRRVLDVGCGNGYLLSHYARGGAQTAGIDLTAAGIGLSRRRFQLEGLAGAFTQGNAEALPFAAASFDLVLSMGVLHHTPNTAGAVDEIHRVLKPGGEFLVMLYHRNSLAYRWVFSVGRFLKPRYWTKSLQEMVNRVDGDENPLGRVYSRREMADLLRGFESVETQVGCLDATHFGKEWLGRLVPAPIRDRMATRWGWFLYARGRKPAASR